MKERWFMRNRGNRIIVVYPNGQVRLRNCQSTVVPSKEDIGNVRDINDWFLMLKVHQDLQYHAYNAVNDHVEMEALLLEAKGHLNKTV